MPSFVRRILDGPGGVREVTLIAVPMIISSAATTVMLFFDRMFLSVLGTEHLAASMAGGLTSFIATTFFIGILNYVNPLTAQYLGSGQPEQCGISGVQGLLVALASAPIILAIIPVGRGILAGAGHDPLQTELQVEYFTLLTLGCIFPLLSTAWSGFFCGIGRTPVVMVANLAAMLVNIGANYLLIFGKLGFPALGIRGAAFGTILGSSVGTLLLALVYYSPALHHAFQTRQRLRYDRDVFRRLMRYGLPSGVEFFATLAAFNFFILVFHSYGSGPAAAITIVFNWDLVAFLPLLGLNIAVTSLTGRYMGSGRPEVVTRTAHSGLLISLLYALVMIYLFLFQTGNLIAPFTRGGPPGDYELIRPLATQMLHMASIYLLGTGLLVVYDGVLRGAGDTRWTMTINVTIHWIMAGTSWILIRRLQVSPLTAWCCFILLIFVISIALILRYRGGRWRSLRVVEPSPIAPPPPDLL